VILVVYDLSSKWLGIGKPLLVALLMISFYPLAFAQAGSPAGPRSATLYLFPIWLFCTSFGYEILKDLRDVPGDETAGKRQVWVRRSPRRALLLSRVAILVGAGVLIGPYHAGCGSIYLWIALPAIGVAIASCFVHSRRAQALIYAECVIVGIAAAADMIALT
jgi:4-hydroxybenzoate polyprenyltransferase